jgi:hypothetical protein
MRYKVDEIAIATLIGNTPFFDWKTLGALETEQTEGTIQRVVKDRLHGGCSTKRSRLTAQGEFRFVDPQAVNGYSVAKWEVHSDSV